MIEPKLHRDDTNCDLTEARRLAQQALLDGFSPAAVLVNAKCQALYSEGPTEEVLSCPFVEPKQDLLSMVRKELRPGTRLAVDKSVRSGLTSIRSARVKRGGVEVSVQIVVTPVTSPSTDIGTCYLVVFRFGAESHMNPVAFDKGFASAEHLADQLLNVHERFGIIAARLECLLGDRSGDITAGNNPPMLSNSPRGSLNGTKAELRALNLQLSDVQKQLELKISELTWHNRYLVSAMEGGKLTAFGLHHDLRIAWISASAHGHFKLMPSDVGRPITDFVLDGAGLDLVRSARAALEGAASSSHEFQDVDGRSYVRRISACGLEGDKPSGVVVTYMDITDLTALMTGRNHGQETQFQRRDRTDQVRMLSSALAMAEENERHALAQDLHDDLGQLMAIIAIKVGAVKAHRMPASLRRAVDECSLAVDQANRKLRSLAFKLNPPMLEELGFDAALEWLGEEMHRLFKLDVHVIDDGTPKNMDRAVSATLFRAIRELLTNVAKHAAVSTAMVTMAKGEGDFLVVTVADTGLGFDLGVQSKKSGRGGFGLLSVYERVELIGGEMTVRSNPGDGTSVLLKVPLLTPDETAPQPIAGGRS